MGLRCSAGGGRLAERRLQPETEADRIYGNFDIAVRGDRVQNRRAGIAAIAQQFRGQQGLSYQRPFQLTCAQVREVMEAMATGSFANKFHALQQALMMSS